MNLPNSLTLSRIFIVPILVVVFMTGISEQWLGIPRQILGVALFLGASATDWLDGYLARRCSQVTTLGMLLDPIADKLLICAALISLVENKLAPGWAVVIIVGREFAVSGLRNIASQHGFTISASKMGKFKMLSQVVAIALLMLGSVNGSSPVNIGTSSYETTKHAFILFLQGDFTVRNLQLISYGLGRAVMWMVVVSSLWSMYNYFKDFYGVVQDRVEKHRYGAFREVFNSRRRLRASRRQITKPGT